MVCRHKKAHCNRQNLEIVAPIHDGLPTKTFGDQSSSELGYWVVGVLMVLLRQPACPAAPSGSAAALKVTAAPSCAVLSWGSAGIIHAGAWPPASLSQTCSSCPWVWTGMCLCWYLLRFPKVVFLLGYRLALSSVTTATQCLIFFVYLVSNMYPQLQHSGDFSMTSLLLL